MRFCLCSDIRLSKLDAYPIYTFPSKLLVIL
nr:MAG TPA: hypothetical protein [Caudoviricetes sp.]